MDAANPSTLVSDVSRMASKNTVRVQELCESGGGRPGLPVPKSQTPASPYSLCGHKAALKKNIINASFKHLLVPTVSVDIKQL